MRGRIRSPASPFQLEGSALACTADTCLGASALGFLWAHLLLHFPQRVNFDAIELKMRRSQ
eukprot:2936497-Rhodomonas_salina.2